MWAGMAAQWGLSALIFLALSIAPAHAQLNLVPNDVPRSVIVAPSAVSPSTAAPTPTPSQNASPRRTNRKPAEQAALNKAEEPPQPATPSNFPRRLPQSELRNRFFDGEPIISRGRGSAALITLVFSKEGVVERTNAKGEKVIGRWKFLGDSYCSRWHGEKKDTCYTVVQDGEVTKVVFFTRAIATWSRTGTPPPP